MIVFEKSDTHTDQAEKQATRTADKKTDRRAAGHNKYRHIHEVTMHGVPFQLIIFH